MDVGALYNIKESSEGPLTAYRNSSGKTVHLSENGNIRRVGPAEVFISTPENAKIYLGMLGEEFEAAFTREESGRG